MRLLFITFVTLVISGCQTSSLKPTGQQYRPHPQVNTAQIWINPQISKGELALYAKPNIRLVEAKGYPGDRFSGVTSTELLHFQSFFRTALSSKLDSHLPESINDSGRPMDIVITLMGARRHPPERTTLDYIPFRLLINMGKEAANALQGIETTVLTAEIQINAYEKGTDVLLFSIQDSLSGELYHWQGKERTVKDLETIAITWAERLSRNYSEFQRSYVFTR